MKRQGAFYVPRTKRAKTLTVVPESEEKAEISVLRRQTTKLASDLRKLKSSREVHYHDETDAGLATPYDVTNRVAVLCDPIQGDGRTQRAGDSISPISIDLRMRLQSNTAFGNVARVLLIQSKERFVPVSNAATGTSAVWEDAGTALAPMSQFFWDNRQHFKVLHDEVVRLGSANADSSIVYLHIYKKLSGKINFLEETSAPAQGQIYLVMTSNMSNAGGGAPTIAWTSRVCFHDS